MGGARMRFACSWVREQSLVVRNASFIVREQSDKEDKKVQLIDPLYPYTKFICFHNSHYARGPGPSAQKGRLLRRRYGSAAEAPSTRSSDQPGLMLFCELLRFQVTRWGRYSGCCNWRYWSYVWEQRKHAGTSDLGLHYSGRVPHSTHKSDAVMLSTDLR